MSCADAAAVRECAAQAARCRVHAAAVLRAAPCHGPWTMIEAGGVAGRTMTSYGSIKSDLKNAGASWVDEPVVVDRGLVTSRNPGDLKAFNTKMIEEFAEGPHPRRGA